MAASKSVSGNKGTAADKSGDMRKEGGAGAALAAHTKDGKSTGKSGQNVDAAKKK